MSDHSRTRCVGCGHAKHPKYLCPEFHNEEQGIHCLCRSTHEEQAAWEKVLDDPRPSIESGDYSRVSRFEEDHGLGWNPDGTEINLLSAMARAEFYAQYREVNGYPLSSNVSGSMGMTSAPKIFDFCTADIPYRERTALWDEALRIDGDWSVRCCLLIDAWEARQAVADGG